MSASFFSKINRSQTPSKPWEPHETSPADGDKLTPELFWKWVDMCKDGDDFGMLEDDPHTHGTADQLPDNVNHQYHFELDPTCVFDLVDYLGTGNLGSVSRMKIRASDIVFACKTSTTRNDVQSLRKEAKTLRTLDHEHIVKFIGTFTPPGKKCYLSLIMSPVGEQNLEDFLRDTKTPEQRTWLKGWILCLASALSYLHGKGVRHEDIKPSNIIHRGNRVLFTDFGSSTQFKPEIRTSTDSPAYGTPRYQAPEVHDKEQEHGARSDIFPLGCVYVEILTAMADGNVYDLHNFCKEKSANAKQSSGFFLYSSAVGYLDSWFANLRPPVEVTIIWKDIVQLMLREDRRERPTAIQTAQLLQTGLIPLVLATDWKCCNHKGLGQLISKRQGSTSTPSQVVRELRHSIKQVDSVDESFHRLDQLHLLLEVETLNNLLGEPLSRPLGKSVENYFVNTFESQASLSDCEDFLEVILHYRLNPNACGTRSMNSTYSTPQRGRLEPRNLWSRINNPSMLHIAACRGHASIVKTLLNAGANPNSDSHKYISCLNAAAQQGHDSLVQILIDVGVDVNQNDRYSKNAIGDAVRGGHSTVVQKLLKAGADPNSEVHIGFSLIHDAVRFGHDEIVQELLQAGVDPNYDDPWLGTALARAAFNGYPSVIRVLVKGGAELNRVSEKDGTALIAACQRGELESVRMLIQLGADVNIDTGVHKTAHAVASKQNYREIVQLLEEAGARSAA